MTSPTRSQVLRRITTATGELLVTAGVLILLFLAYQLVWTNVAADRASASELQHLHSSWADPKTHGSSEIPTQLSDGDAFAVLRIPRLGVHYRVPVVQGVTLDDLAKGVGHYPQTAFPGQIGNFAVAGHRATNGEPFAYLDQLRIGDRVYVETSTRWYAYRITTEAIVEPTKVDVILPVPGRPKASPTDALITLTTCNPRWASYQRLIFHGILINARDHSLGPPAPIADAVAAEG